MLPDLMPQIKYILIAIKVPKNILVQADSFTQSDNFDSFVVHSFILLMVLLLLAHNTINS